MRPEDAVAAAIDKLLAQLRRRVGTVTAIVSTKVTVSVEGGSMTLPRLTSYSPTVGDTVHIDCSIPGAWLVLGKTA